jgi:3-phenylpropionate/trans-cinnamate dioxygenase ferredoxin component
VNPAVAQWVRVAEESALGESLSVSIGDHPIALFRLEDGVHALDDICSHEYSRLSEGEIWAGEVLCAKHGSRFDIRTGAVSGLPATLPVRSYPVRVEDGGIFVLWEPHP